MINNTCVKDLEKRPLSGIWKKDLCQGSGKRHVPFRQRTKMYSFVYQFVDMNTRSVYDAVDGVVNLFIPGGSGGMIQRAQSRKTIYICLV